MQAKKPLTDRAIRALRAAPSGKRHLVWDAQVPGLAVRVTDRGVKTFTLVVRYPGSHNPAPRSLGTYGAITLEAARVKARDWLALISAGTDPKVREAARKADTFAAISEEYFRRDGKALRTAAVRRRIVERLVYPSLGTRPIDSIKRSEIIRLLDGIEDGNGPVMADRTLALIRKIMNWHASRSDDFRSPIVRGMARTKAKERARDRILTDEELVRVWRQAETNGVFGALVRFILLTAARLGEAADMTWSEIADGDWTLPASRNKTKIELVRPLSRAALAVLEERPKAGNWIFSMSGRVSFLSSAHYFKVAFDKACGVNDYVIHDLRRTSRSLMSRAGVDADIAERCLGHVIPGVRGVYDRHEYHREKARAYELLAGLIERIVSCNAKVVSLGERR
jgi:integrase